VRIVEDSIKRELWVANDLQKSCEVHVGWKILNSDGKEFLKGVCIYKILQWISLKLNSVHLMSIIKDQIHKQNNIIFYKVFLRDNTT